MVLHEGLSEFAKHNPAAFYEQDTVQALDWEALKSFSRPGICGQKAAEQSWAAAGAELWDGHWNKNFQPGERSRGQSRDRCSVGAAAAAVKRLKKRPDSSTWEPRKSFCKSCQPVCTWAQWEERSGSSGRGEHGVIWKCMKWGILRNFQRKAPAFGAVLD